MASIFTFDPSPPTVSSPWSTPRTSTPRADDPSEDGPGRNRQRRSARQPRVDTAASSLGESGPITGLEAEPQEGPVEYKLHLLLRPRREFVFLSTQSRNSGSPRTGLGALHSPDGRAVASQSPLLRASSSTPSRRTRLQQLTTQLLWRLQQTSSNHYTTYKHPALQPEALGSPQPGFPGVYPGLEDSKGALYEIGVADDGTFVGLADDELQESLRTLESMASSLGCTVTVLKKVDVGSCQWTERVIEDESAGPQSLKDTTQSSRLWVAEAFVKPGNHLDKGQTETTTEQDVRASQVLTEQLRVTLTGATLSGKSSLLGTLTAGILDNGRGKSRLSLLRHQHEIASGMTSSVTHEVVGYKDNSVPGDNVVNYAAGNVSSWTDIHASCENGRLVFFSDSAGHPRFRRTTIRGLVGWAPHWTLLCVPADSVDESSRSLSATPPSHDTTGAPRLELDLSLSHLDICLKLDLALTIVITKIDLASRAGLRTCLQKILSILKRASRQPVMIGDSGTRIVKTESPFCLSQVPIVLTSSVNGTGIAALHGLLQSLPIHTTPQSKHDTRHGARALFDVEDTYHRLNEVTDELPTLVLSGTVRFGQVTVGDELVLGPFSFKGHGTSAERSAQGDTGSTARLNTSTSQVASTEWCRVRVLSIRNLRLPSHVLGSDQVGTIAIRPCGNSMVDESWQSVRKGMVLIDGEPLSSRTFMAQFARVDVDPLSIGSAVVVYFNRVRASAKIIAGAIVGSEPPQRSTADDVDDYAASYDDSTDEGVAASDAEQLLVTFRFLGAREFVTAGSRVLVMPGSAAGSRAAGGRGGRAAAGLDGFVGRIIDSTDASIASSLQA